MSTKSQSIILPFLVIAGILLAGAVIWKFTGGDDTTPETKSVVAERPATTTEVKPRVSKPDPQPQAQPQPVADEPVELIQPAAEPLTLEERQALKEVARNHMRFAMRYTTPETAIEALRKATEEGNDQIAVDLISYIESAFPTASIPSELLDF